MKTIAYRKAVTWINKNDAGIFVVGDWLCYIARTTTGKYRLFYTAAANAEAPNDAGEVGFCSRRQRYVFLTEEKAREFALWLYGKIEARYVDPT